MSDVIPELIRLIGEQPPVAKLGVAETASRFALTFLQFVGALATAASPLTLFIDDLQWSVHKSSILTMHQPNKITLTLIVNSLFQG